MEALSNYLNDLFFILPPFSRVFFVFTFALVEGLPVIGTFFPGGAIAMIVGALSYEGFINPLTAIVIIAIGSFLGDITGFFIGKKLKHKKWVRKIIEHEKHQEKWDIFDRHLVIIILFSRVVPLLRSIPSLFAGARNIRTRKYLLLSMAGSFIWAIGGVYGGNIISRIAGKYTILVIIILVVGAVAGATLYQKIKQKRAN